jgi:hypothetical protein
MHAPPDRILPREFQELVDHGDDLVAAWMAGETPRPLEAFGRPVDEVEVDEVLRRAGPRPAMVALTPHAPEVLTRFVQARSNEVPRTYVVADEAMARSPVVRAWQGPANISVHGRFGEAAPADWVVFGDEALLFIGPAGEPAHRVLELGGAPARTLARVFAWMFWHRATRERLPGDLEATAALSPMGPDPLARQVSVTLEAGQLSLTGPEPVRPVNAAIAVPAPSEPWSGAAGTLFVAPETTAIDDLSVRAKTGTVCVAADLKLPETFLSPERVSLVLALGRRALRIDIEGAPATRLYQAVEDSARRPAWRFHPALRLRDAERPVRLEPKGPPRDVASQAEVDDGEIEAPELDPMFSVRPPKGRPKTLARTWIHRWRVTQPCAPSGARPAALYEAWQRLDAFARTQTDLLRQRLAAGDGDETGLPEASTFARRRRAIEGVLDEVTESALSTQPEAAARLVDALTAQRSATDELLEDIAVARHEQREAARRSQAEAGHAERAGRAREDLEIKRKEHAHLQAARDAAKTDREAAKDKHERKTADRKLELAERALAATAQAIEKLRPALDAPFVFTPSPRKPFTKTAPPMTPTVPDEVLPTVGRLVEHGGRRFLEIERWSELDAGREDARRLDARLVARRPTN